MSEHAGIKNNQIAYKGETPWHGLGFGVSENATGAEMLKVAGLDWRVQRRMLAMKSAAGKVVIDPLANFRAIVRSDNDEVFQVATDKYHPVQNAEIVDFFRQYCEAGHATMEVVGALNGGAIVWALAKLNGGTTTKLQGVDEVQGRILLATSHDGSIRTMGLPTQVRVICRNTFRAAIGAKMKDSTFMMKHSRKWSQAAADEARAKMGMAIENVAKTNEVAEKLSKVKIDQEGRLEFLEKLLLRDGSLIDTIVDDQQPDNILDAVIAGHELKAVSREDRLGRVGKAILDAIISSPGSDLVTAKNTLWGATNGVTYYVDHERSRTQDTRLTNAWFGSGNNLKAEAMNVAMQMAGIN